MAGSTAGRGRGAQQESSAGRRGLEVQQELAGDHSFERAQQNALQAITAGELSRMCDREDLF